MTTLYQIETNLFQALSYASNPDAGAEERELAKRTAEGLMAERGYKLASIASYIKNLEADVAALEAESKRLKQMAATKERRIKWLEDYILYCEPELSKWSNGVHNLSILPSSAVVPTDDNPDGEVPDQYAVIKTVKTPDKKLIGQVIAQGGTVPGWRVEKRKNLQVK